MKRHRTKTFGIIILVVMTILSGCGTKKIADNGETNNTKYGSYDFWEKENKIELVTNIGKIEEIDPNEQFEETNETEALEESYLKEIEALQKGIIAYFKESYGIDVSAKIEKQKVKTFKSQSTVGNVMGYVDAEDQDVLNLNELLLDPDYSQLFANTYIHETLHQIGMIGESDGLLTEGITDAYTDLILCSMGRESYPTENYYEARTIGYEIIAVDKELPHLYFETDHFSLSKRMTERLAEVPKNGDINPGEKIVEFLTILYSGNLGVLQSNTDPYWYAYDTQTIANAYIRTFEPDHDTIDYVRSHYLVVDFEEA